MDNSFYYYGYASNMCGLRLTLSGIEYQRVGFGKLEDYELLFKQYHEEWHGAMATISPREGNTVYGMVWKIPTACRNQLDSQERSGDFIFPVTVQVTLKDGRTLQCLAYQQPLNLPDSKPSPQYLTIMVKGAQENGLPRNYVQKLQQVETNNYEGECEIFRRIMMLGRRRSTK